MNTPPTIQGKELRPLNNFIWQRLCELLPEQKSRGKSSSHIMIYGYATLAISEKSEVHKSMLSDDYFFDLMAETCIDLTEDDEREIGEYVQAVYNRWEAAQLETSAEGKQATEATRQAIAHT